LPSSLKLNIRICADDVETLKDGERERERELYEATNKKKQKISKKERSPQQLQTSQKQSFVLRPFKPKSSLPSEEAKRGA
jgi:hypothetical protein